MGFLANAVVDDAFELVGVIAGILGCAPNAGDTKFTATADLIVVRAVHPPPCMSAPFLDGPAMCFGVLNCCFHLRLWMLLSGHGGGYALNLGVNSMVVN